MITPHSEPAVWFRLPPGYHSLDTIGPEAIQQQVELLVTYGVLDTAGAQEASRHATAVSKLRNLLMERDAFHLSLGFHPEQDAGVCASLFSLAAVKTTAPSPRVAVARAGLALAESDQWKPERAEFLPLGTAPAAFVCGRMTSFASSGADEVDVLPTPDEVFQARVVMPFPGSGRLLVADLTTTAVAQADAYADILEGIAHTITFRAPEAQSDATPTAVSQILDVLS
jgi:hypothetical protein